MTSFVFPCIFTISPKKWNSYDCNNAVYGWWHSPISGKEKAKQKSHLCKSRSREHDFSSKFRCRLAVDNDFPAYVKISSFPKSSFPRPAVSGLFRLTKVMATTLSRTTTHALHEQARKLSLVLGSKAIQWWGLVTSDLWELTSSLNLDPSQF